MLSQVRITIIGGPGSGAFYLNAPDETVTVGRSPDSQVPLPDPRLALCHFTLTRDGDICRLTDLGSAFGTLVNGQRVQAVNLWDGDIIVAGESVFRVDFSVRGPMGSDQASPRMEAGSPALHEMADGQTVTSPLPGSKSLTDQPIALFRAMEPVPADRPVDPPLRGSKLDRLLAALNEPGDATLYAIIDGAQALELVATARLMGHDVYTLFAGDMAQELAYVGPCLMKLERPWRFLQPWVEALGRNAGVLLKAPSDLHSVHAHLRELFVVKDEEGQEYFFRFYDPRVIRTFLPTCSPSEIREFFGSVTRWIVEDERAHGYEIWSHGRLGLTRRTVPLQG